MRTVTRCWNSGRLREAEPGCDRGLTTLDNAAAKAGHQSRRSTTLIALAVAVTTPSDGCIAVHTKKAVEAGSSGAI
jgi:AhpD family alkylhydroperoxidase